MLNLTWFKMDCMASILMSFITAQAQAESQDPGVWSLLTLELGM